MQKAKREITDFQELTNVLDRCDVIRIGLQGDDYPYVVPVSFGYEVVDGRLFVYFHGAKKGLKHDLIAKNNRVCVEADLFHGYRPTGKSVTANYESVIGFGTVEAVTGDEAVKGLELLLQHCHTEGLSAAHCVALGVTRVYRISLASITGKRRFKHP